MRRRKNEGGGEERRRRRRERINKRPLHLYTVEGRRVEYVEADTVADE